MEHAGWTLHKEHIGGALAAVWASQELASWLDPPVSLEFVIRPSVNAFKALWARLSFL